jgi:hypothetical protein
MSAPLIAAPGRMGHILRIGLLRIVAHGLGLKHAVSRIFHGGNRLKPLCFR